MDTLGLITCARGRNADMLLCSGPLRDRDGASGQVPCQDADWSCGRVMWPLAAASPMLLLRAHVGLRQLLRSIGRGRGFGICTGRLPGASCVRDSGSVCEGGSPGGCVGAMCMKDCRRSRGKGGWGHDVVPSCTIRGCPGASRGMRRGEGCSRV